VLPSAERATCFRRRRALRQEGGRREEKKRGKGGRPADTCIARCPKWRGPVRVRPPLLSSEEEKEEKKKKAEAESPANLVYAVIGELGKVFSNTPTASRLWDGKKGNSREPFLCALRPTSVCNRRWPKKRHRSFPSFLRPHGRILSKEKRSRGKKRAKRGRQKTDSMACLRPPSRGLPGKKAVLSAAATRIGRIRKEEEGKGRIIRHSSPAT